jgi:hypothetical protein
LSNAHLTHFVANLDAFIESFPKGMSSQETTGEGVARSVGVHDLIMRQTRNRVNLGVSLVRLNVAFQ